MPHRSSRGSTRIASPSGEPGWDRKVSYWNKLRSRSTRGYPQRGQPSQRPSSYTQRKSSKGTRQKWTREEYKQVMEVFYKATNNPSETNTTKAAYNIWRLQNPTERPNLDANKLANVRRDIIKSKRLTEMELETIRANVRQATSTPEELNRSRSGIEYTDKQEMVEANVDENTHTLPGSAGRTQKPTETKPDESMITMKNDILRKWETVKYQEMTERPLLPKIKKDRHAHDAIDTANKAIKGIKEGIDGPLTITDKNQIVYATASVITEQIGLKPRQHSRIGKKQKESAWKAKIKKEIQKKRSDLRF